MLNHRTIQIILDFDGTITTKDTIEPLVQSAIAFNHPSLSPSERSQTPEGEAWDNCKSQYLAELAEHYEKENNEPNDGAAVTGLAGLEREQRSLDALRDVELASVQRVGESGIFKGIPMEAFREMGRAAAMTGEAEGKDNRAVVVREDFRGFLGWLNQIVGGEFGVISVNWSWKWVRGVLDVVIGNFNVKIIYGYVVANDIDGSTGMIRGYPLHMLARRRTYLLTTADKLLAQKLMLHDKFSLGAVSPQPLTVYIGDSPTDLSPLLHADIGIIMESPSSTPGALRNLIEKCGYRVLPASKYKELYRKGDSEKVAILLSVNNFMEIKDSGMLEDEKWDPTAAKEAWKKAESED
ncbi:hypothetical protein VE03_00452 [Pseudogymnoascus sp. 23342-1-I1]|nr:hypothetical protein VE03_00452 [Pseudogymnoascus sp. 23342-1-I1]